MPWRVFAAAATGRAHTEHGQPCQDAFAYGLAGDVLCAIVCDGAGSAARAHEGARYVADAAVAKLVGSLESGLASPSSSPEDIQRVIEDMVEVLRDGIATLAAENAAASFDYATTLVGVLCSGEGGWLFHIGDGAAVAEGRTDPPCVSVSRPENGEYGNETYFVTSQDWRARLRLTPALGPLRSVALMTDGATTFAMNRGCSALFQGFMAPVTAFLERTSVDAGSRALQATLDDPRTHLITADDKTMIIAHHVADTRDARGEGDPGV